MKKKRARHQNNFYFSIVLVHLLDKSIDVLLTVPDITTLNEVLELAGSEATSGVGELEGPQEVGGLLEVGADRVDLVDQILHTDNAVLSEVLFNDLVVAEGNTLLVDLSITALVDELADRLQVRITVGNVGVDDGKHLLGGLSETDEDTVVDLEETEKLQDLAGLGGNLVDTVMERFSYRLNSKEPLRGRGLPLDTDNEGELVLGGDFKVALLLGQAGKADLLAFRIAVLLDVRLGTLEDDSTLLLVGLLQKSRVSTRNLNS